MSNVTVIQTKNTIYMGSDSAVSTKLNNKYYRIDTSGKKLFTFDNKVIFCSGNLLLSYTIIEEFKKQPFKDIKTLREIASHYYHVYKINEACEGFDLDILIGEAFNDHTIVYQISPYYNFEIIESVISNTEEVAIITGGIKTQESFDLAYEKLLSQMKIEDLYQSIFNQLSDETIGGTLKVLKITKPQIIELLDSPIVEKLNLKLLNDFVETNKHLIIGERIIGKLLLGEKLIIGDSNGTFTINGNLLTIQDLNEKPRVKLGEYSKGKYGLQLFDKTGNQVVLDEDGMLQTWQEGRTDNVDGYHPLTLYVYIPEQTLSIKKALLRFKLLEFRAYSQTTESGGGTYSSTSSGGGTYGSTGSGGGTYGSTDSGGGTYSSTDGGGNAIVTSGNSGIDVIYGTGQTDPSSGHSHTYRTVEGHKHNITLPSHTHSFSVPSHYHTVNIPSHSHTVDIPSHSHSFSVPAHSHPISHGIYKSTTARQISIHINGINRDYELGGKFNIDKFNLNITPYLIKGQWNVIDLYSSQLGRLDATVFIQALMGHE